MNTMTNKTTMQSTATPIWATPAPQERIPTTVHPLASDASVAVANEIATLIRGKAAAGKQCVLGLATGSTPTRVYDELVRMHEEEGLSFANVVSFNLDEYFPMQPDELQSFDRFMHEYLFDRIDIKPENVHIPDGTVAPEEVRAWCEHYEESIAAAGGIDLQLLGIGRTGHIGFNEPGSGKESNTRLISLDRVTLKDAASDFFGEENVPDRAITMGVGTILCARRIVIMAFGEGKSVVVAKSVEGEITKTIAASFLQEHPNAALHLDLAAAAQLTRCKTPWVLGDVEWDAQLKRKAVIWLAQTVGKPILKLTNEDFNEHHLQDLVASEGRALNINLEVFRALQRTISGWPGGKPVERRVQGDIVRPGDDVFPKRVLIFSPHPDDDVISMGGTLQRLVEQGHDVHVAYQVSGSIAVFDSTAQRFADFAADFNEIFGFDHEKTDALEAQMAEALRAKTPGDIDTPDIQKLKALIRRGEARAASRYCGVEDDNLHFLDMPFYETGRVRKKPLGDKDVSIVAELMQRVQPHLIYAAGDLSDPHGTHRTCLEAIVRSWGEVRTDAWAQNAVIWLYRGAWQEWGVDQFDLAVPLSPAELQRKINAIHRHESQKDKALFPGPDEREFWQRAEQRNQSTARLLDELGLAEYEAVEAFVRWDGISAIS